MLSPPSPLEHLKNRRDVPRTFSPTHGTIKHNNFGYRKASFAGKDKHKEAVVDIVTSNRFLPELLVPPEVDWFYSQLGIDDRYFSLTSPQEVADHVESLYGAKSSAVYIFTSPPGVSLANGPQYKQRIDSQYLDNSNPTDAWRLESYRAIPPATISGDDVNDGAPIESVAAQLRSYFVSKCDFVDTKLDEQDLLKPGVNIREVGDKTFLEKATDNTLEIYQELMDEALRRMGPVVAAYDVENSQNLRNGVTIISLYLHPLQGIPNEGNILQIINELLLIYVLPSNSLFTGLQLSVQESTYIYSAWVFGFSRSTS
ncbi:NAD-specific glutamate dehydrogenase [Rhodotorula toruloides]|nr:NAD-specific glutamate dehydrogenase [Rhodotorula toruloides]